MVKRRNSRKDETVVIKVLVMVKKKKKINKLGAKGVYAVRQGTHKQ